jgi:hypothetical protein
MPVLGSRTSAVGFERQEIVFSPVYQFLQRFRVSTGPIEDIHDKARDSVKVNFPSIQVGALHEDAMSGP